MTTSKAIIQMIRQDTIQAVRNGPVGSYVVVLENEGKLDKQHAGLFLKMPNNDCLLWEFRDIKKNRKGWIWNCDVEKPSLIPNIIQARGTKGTREYQEVWKGSITMGEMIPS